jgi:hypothetical protein
MLPIYEPAQWNHHLLASLIAELGRHPPGYDKIEVNIYLLDVGYAPTSAP